MYLDIFVIFCQISIGTMDPILFFRHVQWVRLHIAPWLKFLQRRDSLYLEWYISLLSFRFSFLYIWSTLHSVIMWSVSSLSYPYPITKILSGTENTLRISLKMSSIFSWTCLPLGQHQMVVLYVCTYLIGMKMSSNMMTANLNFRLW